MSVAGIGELVESLSGITLVSETDVRTQAAVPLLDLLGYPSANRAEEFPIHGFEGGKPLRAKPADIVLFDSVEHGDHRERESRGWVADHALLVVELKKPKVSLDNAHGQAQFYSHWAKVPFYVMTNGKELVVYRMSSFFDDVREVYCQVDDLSHEWGRIEKLLSFEAVKRYSAKNEIKSQDLPLGSYAYYLKTTYLELSAELERTMERTVSEQVETGPLAFPIGLSGSMGGQRLSSAPYTRLLDVDGSVLVTAKLGGGKTHLVEMLAKELIRATEEDSKAPIPIILRARMWKRDFDSIAEGIKKEINAFVPAAESSVRKDLEAGRYVVLLDGLDEAPQDQVDTLYAEILRVARHTATRIVATCREQDYKQELRDQMDECSIDPLTREQVIEYASGELGAVPGAPTGVQFLYGIGEDLAQMVLNPLFLVMTVAVMKTKTLSENRQIEQDVSAGKLNRTHRSQPPRQDLGRRSDRFDDT